MPTRGEFAAVLSMSLNERGKMFTSHRANTKADLENHSSDGKICWREWSLKEIVGLEVIHSEIFLFKQVVSIGKSHQEIWGCNNM